MKNLYTTPEINIDILTECDTMTASSPDPITGDDATQLNENVFAAFRWVND